MEVKATEKVQEMGVGAVPLVSEGPEECRLKKATGMELISVVGPGKGASKEGSTFQQRKKVLRGVREKPEAWDQRRGWVKQENSSTSKGADLAVYPWHLGWSPGRRVDLDTSASLKEVGYMPDVWTINPGWS